MKGDKRQSEATQILYIILKCIASMKSHTSQSNSTPTSSEETMHESLVTTRQRSYGKVIFS